MIHIAAKVVALSSNGYFSYIEEKGSLRKIAIDKKGNNFPRARVRDSFSRTLFL